MYTFYEVCYNYESGQYATIDIYTREDNICAQYNHIFGITWQPHKIRGILAEGGYILEIAFLLVKVQILYIGGSSGIAKRYHA